MIKECDSCGAEYATNTKFCAQCGRNLEEKGNYPLGSRISVRQHSEGLDLVKHLADGGHTERAVVGGHIEILEHLDVDGDDFWRVQLEEEIVTNFRGLVSRLKASGRVLDRRSVDDVLSVLLRGCPKSRTSHATVGVYVEEGALRFCSDPVPVKEEQGKAWEAVRADVDREGTADEIQAYLDVLGYWHDYEVLPPLGLGLAAPFALVLRSRGILVPHLFNWAPETDLGKSLTGLIASERMFGLEPTSGPAISSDFRLAAHLDAACLPRAVEEAEKLPQRLWPALKESAERRLADKRGTPDLGMLDYLSRGVLLMSGNTLPISTAGVLKRFLVNRFDSSAGLHRRGRSREVERAVNDLKPVGFCLIWWAVEMWPTEEALLEALGDVEEVIASELTKWASPKRPQAWAVVYLGLLVLEEGCRRTDVAWRAPSKKVFVRDVVEPVESSTWGLRRGHVDRFEAWFSMWRARNEWTVRDGDEFRVVVRGEGQVFKDDTVNVGYQAVQGWWIGSGLLDEFNRTADGEARIPSLAELAKQAADAAGLPYSVVMDIGQARSPQARKVKIGGRSVRAAFVPSIGDYGEFWNIGTFEGPEQVPKGSSGAGAFGTEEPGGLETALGSKAPTELPIAPYSKRPLIEEEAREVRRANPKITARSLTARILQNLRDAKISGGPVPDAVFGEVHPVVLETLEERRES